MADSTAARRYAQAMIEIAVEAGVADKIGEDLDGFAQVMAANDGQLGDALCSPVFTVDERRSVLAEILPKLDLHPLSSNLLNLANDKGRLGLVSAIAEAYTALADERAGRVQVVIETAEPLSNKLEGDIRTALEAETGKQVVLHAVVVPSLIGGIVARVGGKVYDTSIRSRLEQIKGALMTGAFHPAAPAAQA